MFALLYTDNKDAPPLFPTNTGVILVVQGHKLDRNKKIMTVLLRMMENFKQIILLKCRNESTQDCGLVRGETGITPIFET